MLWKLFLIMKLTLLQQSVHSLPHLYLLGREACIPCSFFLPNFSEPSYKECARWVFAKGAQTFVKSLCWSATERVKTQQTDAPLPCAFCLLSALSILEHCNHLLTLWKETKIIRKDRKLWCYMWYKHGKSIQECIFFSVKKTPTCSEICQNTNTKNIQRTQNLAVCSTVRSMLEDGHLCANETQDRT